MTVVNEMPGTKIMASINGDYFSWSNMLTTGPFIYDGVVRKSNPANSNRPAFGITRMGAPVFLNPPAGQANQFLNNNQPYGDNSLRHLVGGNVWIIYNGVKQTFNDTTVEPRTTIGMRDDKKVIAIAVDGRNVTLSNGMSYAQLQAVYEALDAKYAFNLDGRGSTTIVLRDKDSPSWSIMNSPYDNPPRSVANGIGFVVND